MEIATVLLWLLALWGLVGLARGPGLLGRLRRLVGVLGTALLAALLSSVLLLHRVLVAFAGATLVAQVTVQPLAGEAFELRYEPVAGGPEAVQRASLRGDQWVISGGIIKWRPWLTALGLPSYHHPVRLAGQFSDLSRQRAAPPAVHALDPATDWVWEAFYRAAPRLPFIEAAYGSSAYVYVEPRMVYEVYVSPSGYLIKRRPP